MKLHIRAQQLHARDEHIHFFWGSSTGFKNSAHAGHRRDMRVLALAQGTPVQDVFKGGPVCGGEIAQAEAWAAEV